MTKFLECSAQGKRPAVKDFLGTLELGTEIFSTTEEYKSSWKMDLTVAVARLSPVKLFKEEDQRRGENNETVLSAFTNCKSMITMYIYSSQNADIGDRALSKCRKLSNISITVVNPCACVILTALCGTESDGTIS